jgi:hypothetical protein
VPKKKEDNKLVQLNIRMQPRLLARLDKVSAALGTDRSNLVRLMVSERLPDYEARAKALAEGGKK